PADGAPGNNGSMVAGLQNSVSNMGGVVGPIVTGAIVGATGSFIPALVFSAALIGLAILNYLFLLGKVEPISFEPTPETHHSHDQRNADARA
ncbi:MFS transporter, partial [Burkholderia cepacia]|nr:MFS transporter [Burkholderia cepacia]